MLLEMGAARDGSSSMHGFEGHTKIDRATQLFLKVIVIARRDQCRLGWSWSELA